MGFGISCIVTVLRRNAMGVWIFRYHWSDRKLVVRRHQYFRDFSLSLPRKAAFQYSAIFKFHLLEQPIVKQRCHHAVNEVHSIHATGHYNNSYMMSHVNKL
jgi:hypothetical protein